MFNNHFSRRGSEENGGSGLSSRVIILDRDGTIIKEKEYLSDPSGVEFICGSIEGLEILQRMGFKLVIITNQSGIKRGYFTEEQLDSIHKKLIIELNKKGVTIDGIYFSPDLPEEESQARKPNTDLIDQAVRELSIKLNGSYCIGDKRDDIEMGKRKGLKTILVLTGYGIKTKGTVEPHYIADNLLEAARWIKRNEER